MSHVKGIFSDKILFIRDEILKVSPKGSIEKIYLFGSYACGDINEDSDLDICVLINNRYKNRYNDIDFNINKIFMKNYFFPSDVLVYMENYYMKQDSCALLKKEINKKGKLLYG